MPKKAYPVVYVEEVAPNARAIAGVGTCTLGMVGLTQKGPAEACPITSFQEYCETFGNYLPNSYLAYAVEGFFINGGRRCFIKRIKTPGKTRLKAKHFIGQRPANNQKQKPSGLAALRDIDDINIIYLPDIHALDTTEADALLAAIKEHCEQLHRFAILDISQHRRHPDLVEKPIDSGYVTAYYPWLQIIDQVNNRPIFIPPGGHVAGVFARSDLNRGVHKAPADEIIKGALAPEQFLSTEQQATLTQQGVNPLRQFPGKGVMVWGARTCASDPAWKYITVRRLVNYLEESIARGLNWAVFEPNDELLWHMVKSSITNFLYESWRNGALMGARPEEGYFVRCDRTTMTQSDMDNGRLICLVGVAVLKPAEFITFRLQLPTGT